MQFKVPQDVQQADRIVAFLTLPQLIICVVGLGIAYGVYTVLVRQGLVWVFWLPPVLIIVGLTAAFAFLRIANLPFHRYLAIVIERFVTPSKRVWVKGADRVITSEESLVTAEEKKAEEKAKATSAFQVEKQEKLQNIGEITDVLDTLKNEPENVEPIKEIDKTPDEDLLGKAFLDEPLHPPVPVKAPVVTPEDKIMAMSSVPKPAPMPVQNPTPTPVPAPAPVAEPSPMPARSPEPTTVLSATPTPVSTPAAIVQPKPIPAAVPQTTPASASPNPNPAKKKRRRRRKKKNGNEIAAVIPSTGLPRNDMTPSNAPSVSAPTPPLPAWLNEKPEVKKEEVVPVRDSSAPVGMTKKEPEPTLETPKAEPILESPEPKPVLEAPEPEPMLEAPEVEPMLEAPEVPKNLDAPSSSNEIAAVVPSTELPRNDITPPPTVLSAPPVPAVPKPSAKTSETLTAEELKKGKTITFS